MPNIKGIGHYRTMSCLFSMLFYVCSSCLLWILSVSADTITPNLSLSDGKTLISKSGGFELGFFSPGSSKNQYLGIWYKNIPVRTVVWVANRQSPIKDLSGTLMFNKTGNLALVSHKDGVVWSSNLLKQVQNPVAQLLDSGNFVIREERESNSDIYVWQSFDHPCDTLLPGMKLGWDLRVGLNRRLSSWMNFEDPSPGELTYGIELHEYPESVMWKGSKIYSRSGPWNGLRYSGTPNLKPNPLYTFNFTSNEEEVYYTYQLKNGSVITRLVLNQTTSKLERSVWIESEQIWKPYFSAPLGYCDNYGLCGANGICDITGSPVCRCLNGFKPKSLERWKLMEWSHGCIRDKPLSCQSTEGFDKFEGVKLPDTTNCWVNKNLNISECRDKCLKNCTCMAYTNSDIRGNGSGCAIWFDDLTDISQVFAGGDVLNIRMPASGLGTNNEAKGKADLGGKKDGTKWVIPVCIGISGILILSYCIWMGRTRTQGKILQYSDAHSHQASNGVILWNFFLILITKKR
ncbi:unnamed protein product [Ilex paraguariensis]|uniref:Uncharacterized protein n=1 Tax=Ilex paraguariensis TaxID=185542 RepID=A0ABC8RY93_9AQUA